MSSVNHSKYNRENDDHSVLIDSDDLFEGENKSTSLKSINIEVERDSCLIIEELHGFFLGNKNGKNHKSPIPLNPFINFKNMKKYRHNYTQKNNKKKQFTYVSMIIDSGATRHCCNNLKLMNNVRNVNTTIMVGNGDIMKATKMGDIGLLKNILYLPQIKHCLFSLSYFVPETKDVLFVFKEDYCEIKVRNKVIARGILNDRNLYKVLLITGFINLK